MNVRRRVRVSDIPLFAIILVFVFIKFGLSHLSLSFYIVFVFFLVPVCI